MRATITHMTDIALGTTEDIERCVDLWVQALRHRDGEVAAEAVGARMHKLFDGPLLRFALAGEPLAGFALTAPKSGDETVAVLERIAVLPASSGKGIGRALLKDAMLASKDAQYDTIELAVRRGNPAIRLYEQQGFRPVSGPVPHPLGGEPMITFSVGL